VRGFARGACFFPALLRRTGLGMVTPSSSDTARSLLAARFATGFSFGGGTFAG
jgi:hypothetical protein